MAFNILLVEDNAAFRHTLAEILHSYFPSSAITEAGSGEDALNKMQELHPDIVLMDIHLPGQNGLQSTREIRKRSELTRIVILSSHDTPEYREQAIADGADYFLSKADGSCLADIIARIEMTQIDKSTLSGRDIAGARRYTGA